MQGLVSTSLYIQIKSHPPQTPFSPPQLTIRFNKCDRHCRLLKELLLFCNDYSVEEKRKKIKEEIKFLNDSTLFRV